jgi:hypothetical protein
MAQVVSYAKTEEGNFILEVKPTARQHTRIKTTQIAGTNWDEPLTGLFCKDPEGNDAALFANVSIRYSNTYNSDLLPAPEIVQIPQVVNGNGNGHSNGRVSGTVIPFRR